MAVAASCVSLAIATVMTYFNGGMHGHTNAQSKVMREGHTIKSSPFGELLPQLL